MTRFLAQSHTKISKHKIHKVDELIRNWEEISQVKPQEDIKAAVLMNLSPDTVRNTFDLDGKDRDYKTLRDELVNWVQIRRERESGGLERLEGTKKSGIGGDDMDIGALIRRKQQELQNLEDQLWYTQECEQEWYSDQDVQETGEGQSIDAVNLKGKGKGKGTGFEKLKGFGKGKGFSKGKKGAKGKGKFQGECYNCGMWCHSARFCQEHWKGKGNVPQTTFNTEVEEARPGAKQELSELEFTRPRHVIGSVEITKPVHFETKNNFQELADDEEGAAPSIGSRTWRCSRRMRRTTFTDVRTIIARRKAER